MVAVGAAHQEDDGTVPQPPGLTLDFGEYSLVFDQEVAAGVLAERHVKRVASLSQSEHDGERRAITDVFGVVHVVRLAYVPDGAATMWVSPE